MSDLLRDWEYILILNISLNFRLYGTMPNPIKSAQNSYKNQRGRIENYTTGHSSVSEKEKKEVRVDYSQKIIKHRLFISVKP